MTTDTDYIIDILCFLENNNIDTTNYNEELSYSYNTDDVYVVEIDGYILKFVQNYYNKKYQNFTLYYKDNENNQIEIKGYDNIKQELIILFNIYNF